MIDDMQKQMDKERLKYEIEIKEKVELFHQLEKNKQNEEEL